MLPLCSTLFYNLLHFRILIMVIKNNKNPITKIGLIGLGHWAKEAYLPILLTRKDVEIIGVSARTYKTLKSAKSLIGNTLKLFQDYRDLLKQPEIDAVFIGLPYKNSAPVIIDSIQADKHIFVEPPLYLGNKFIYANKLLSNKNISFHIDLELNYLPVITRCKELLASNNFGEVLSSKIELQVDWSKEWNHDILELKNNVINLSTWYISLIDLFSSSGIRSVKYLELEKGTYDIGSILIKYMDGYSGEWKFNLRNSPNIDIVFNLILANGIIKCDLLSGILKYQYRNKKIEIEHHKAQNPIFGFAGMQESVNEFINSIFLSKTNLFNLARYRNIKDIHSNLYTYCDIPKPD